MLPSLVLSALVIVVPVLGAPALVPITKRAGAIKPDSYIIVLKDDVSKDSFLSSVTGAFADSGSSVTYTYDVINGFAATLKGPGLDLVRRSSGIEFIEQDGIMSIDYEPGVEAGATELEQSAPVQNLEKRTDGEPEVHIYGIDTGIYIKHSCFGGRARWGATFGGYKQEDGNGHGTHTAGTAVGDRFSVATKAKIIAVKVLSDSGSGSTSDVVAGVDYTHTQFQENKTPSIATMSLGGPLNSALDKAVKNAIADGLHFAIAAGNDNLDASGTSPASVKAANTIGAVDSSKNNEKASFSNWGSLIDVWAPGVNILSAWIGSPDATNAISGTSMATPYVAGVLAVALEEYGQMTPEALSQALKDNAAKDAVTFGIADTAAGLVSTHSLVKRW